MFITIYLIGCIFAVFICINEILRMDNHYHNIHKDYDESEPQYGMMIVVILLSWIAVIIYCIGLFNNNK